MKSDAFDRPLSVVLICSAGSVSDLLVSAWRDTLHDLQAIVVSGTSRRKPLSPAMARAAGSGVRVLRVEHPVDWLSLEAQLADVRADVLVCYGFMRLIPASFLRRFGHGGVNFHPALLPGYAGPHPTRCLVADGTYGTQGGLTLHAMTEAFDEGPILARARFLPEDFRSARLYVRLIAETMKAMIREVLPLHCAGLLKEERQDGGVRIWAEYHPRSVVATARWSAADIAAAAAFLGRRKGLRLRLGEEVRVFELWRNLGAPTGRKPAVGLFTVEFDCADARVSMFRANRAGRLAMRLRDAWSDRSPAPAPRRVEFARVDDDG